ncbi:hypothetical protein K438DRAFT_1983854 [Mycena galopus ATCC 62051]|nr:hypothetical protein K438DRAFT_1983854 [Mycena galopus ATCC 62051]
MAETLAHIAANTAEQVVLSILRSSNGSSKISLAKALPMFDSEDKSKWETWHDALTDYTGAYESEFDSNKRKVYYMISLLGKSDSSSCPAALYMFEELQSSFKDQNGVQSAHLCLTTTQQGKAGMAKFIQVLELNAEEAGYHPSSKHDDIFFMEMLEGLINKEIQTQLFAGGMEAPQMYKELRRHLNTISNNLEREKLREAQVARKNPWWQQAPPNKNTGPTAKNTGGAPDLARTPAPGNPCGWITFEKGSQS